MQADTTERWIEHTLRGLYSAALYLALPITLYHLIWRGFRQRAYLARWHERYAFYGTATRSARLADDRLPDAASGVASDASPGVAATGEHAPAGGSDPLWVHAVSVGEVNAAAPLVNALLREHPQRRVLVTTITPTGSDRVRALWDDRVEHVYLPYDLTGAVERFLARFHPRVALIVETELWPNLLFACRDHGVPAYLVNARLSERSLRGYRPLRALVSRALRTFRRVLAQSEGDAARFVRLGAREDAVEVCGNLKFDTRIDPDIAVFADAFRTRTGERPVWIAASTHPDEEAAVLAIDRHLRARWPSLLTLWAPRHPERFRGVAQQAIDAGLTVATRRLTGLPDEGDALFVIDTLGELTRFYACADVAFVGGSLQPIGGHNLLEPAAVGTAMVTGPHLHNFSDIAARLRQAGALRIGESADAVTADIEALLADPAQRRTMAEAASALLEEGRGALRRTLDIIATDLD